MCDFNLQAFGAVCQTQRNAHCVPFAVLCFFYYSNEYKLFEIILPHAKSALVLDGYVWVEGVSDLTNKATK